MSLQDKYKSVLSLAHEYNLQGLNVSEEAGKLKITGSANTQYEKNKLWDKIKEVGGGEPTDLNADIKVLNNDYYHLHTVQSGENLSKIAKQYFNDANSYNKIFDANKDQLQDPDKIQVGQKLKIPKP